MVEFLPFFSLTSHEIIDLWVSESIRNYDTFKDISFNRNVVFDRYDASACPEYLNFDHEVECNYFYTSDLYDSFKKYTLNIMSFNIRSVPRNIDEFFSDFHFGELDVIGMCETRLTESSSSLYKVRGYELFCRNRNVNGGGVLIYSKIKNKPFLIEEFSLMETYLESVFLRLTVGGENFIVGNLYRPPNKDIDLFTLKLSSILEKISNEYPHFKVILMGDFNIDLLKIAENIKYFNYYSAVCSQGYSPCINRPTRVTATTHTIIDNIWIKNVGIEESKSGIIFSEISDHFPIFLKVPINVPRVDNSETYVSYEYRLRNEQCDLNFRLLLEQIDFENYYEINDVEVLYNTFANDLNLAYNSAYPVVRRKKKVLDLGKPYINSELRSRIIFKHKLQKKYRKYPLTFGEEYRRVRNDLNKSLGLAKKLYYQKKLESGKNNPKHSWKVVGEVLGSKQKQSSIIELKNDNETIVNPVAIANLSNDFFTNIGTNLSQNFINSNSFMSYLNVPINDSFSFSTVTLDELTAVMNNLESSSPGHDNIPISAYKNNIDILGVIILYICNKSLSQGIFPDQLKVAKITPVHKNGDRKCIGNYRPISVLNSFSKIIEKIVVNQLNNYLQFNSILSNCQFGFRAALSTENAIQKFLNDIYTVFSRSEYAICIFMDLCKAFDTVNHRILLQKLSYYGICGNAHRWFTSYFCNRQQFVSIGTSKSSLRRVSCGVAQGSIVGPLLFILYMNDIVRSSSILKFLLYADDTSLVHHSRDINELVTTVNTELDHVAGWFHHNQLTLNVEKTNYVIFCSRRSTDLNISSICIGDCVLARVYEARFLGIILDPQLKFDLHLLHVVKKLAKFVPIMNKIRDYFNTSTLKLLYHAIVYPNFIYCISAWGGVNKTTLAAVNIMQKGIIRAMLGVNRRTHSEPLFRELGLLNVDQIHRYTSGTFVYRSLRDVHMFKFRSFAKNTRDSVSYLLNVPFVTSTRCRQGITFRGPTIYNSIPLNIRNIINYDSFEIIYKRFILG